MSKLNGYGRQWIDDNDINAVVSVLKSDFLTQGSKIKEFENNLSKITGAKYAVVVSNGTAALHLAVASLELKEGRGITSPITFMASSNAFIYNNLIPDFVDIDKDTYNLSSNKFKEKIAKFDDIKVVIPVHFAGQPCNMKTIFKTAKDNNIFIIEDASHSIGSYYEDGSAVGSCKYSDLTTFSFHPVKTITTGEGGAILTNNENLYNKLIMLRNHGITKDKSILKHKNNNLWYHEMQILGFNYRMSDIHAALGISQLKKLNYFVNKRRELVKYYNKLLQNIDYIKIPFEKNNVFSAFHLYVVQIDFEQIGISRNDFMKSLKNYNIGSQVHYIPVYRQPFYEKYKFNKKNFPVAENFYKQALSLPLFPLMNKEDVEKVVKTIKTIVEKK